MIAPTVADHPDFHRVRRSDLYFNAGGLRYYVRKRWGFQPEFMVCAGSNTYVRFAGSIFYQFGE